MSNGIRHGVLLCFPERKHFLSFFQLTLFYSCCCKNHHCFKNEEIVCDPIKMVEDKPPSICKKVYVINKDVSEWNCLPFLETICLVIYDVFHLLFIGLNFPIVMIDTQAGLNTSIQNKHYWETYLIERNSDNSVSLCAPSPTVTTSSNKTW